MKKLVSIVIPVYNTEAYLKKCLDSVLNQTYQNLEIIIVDDGSIDDSKEIINDYMQRDSRIKYFFQENQGPGMARNYGIREADGEYLSFIDSDDWVAPTFIEKLMGVIKDNDMVSLCGTIKTDGENETLCSVSKTLFESFRGIARFKKLINLRKLKDSGILFSKLSVCEDLEFYGKVFLYHGNYSVVDECLYYYFQRSNSLIHTFNHQQKDAFIAVKSLEEYIIEIGKSEELHDMIEFIYIFHIIHGYLLRGLKTNAITITEIDEVLDFIESKFPTWEKNKYLEDDSDITPEIKSTFDFLKKRKYHQ